MTRLLRLTNYQFLGLLIGVPIVIILRIMIFSEAWLTLVAIPFLLTFCFILYFGWHWTLGIYLYKRLQASTSLSIITFKILFWFMLLYFGLSCIVPFLGNMGLIFTWIFSGLRYVGSLSFFYCIWFIAKALNQVEENKPVKFKDYISDIFLIMVFPVGIFLIQPRVNEIFLKKTNMHYG